ncbi:hypothetical protein AQUCO_00700198v1 [Aquilegia coerulea]|uniref:non-specific serine/threonine protein kinase n=1 Tax=Aquilegia coerulea TaxID=218851 RepID=A0A2G5EJE8_AQUCA|nr:hypothetical protein AQUCO_00700198v1 [Aquilegia coerulea]
MAGNEKHSGNVDRSSSTSFVFGLKLYVLVGIVVGILMFVSVLILLYYLYNRRRKLAKKNISGLFPMISKEITEVVKVPDQASKKNCDDEIVEKDDQEKMIKIEIENVEKSVSIGSESESSSSVLSSQEVLIGWGRWYTYKELEIATGGFAAENVIGEGGYGVVYRGVMPDKSLIAVKNLFNNKGQAEQEFKVEVEAIGKVRHKNLVGLIGYCVEGTQRMLIYEYVNNGNLEQWLHGDAGPLNPLTWDVRIKIAIGTAKGLAYLHEGLEPKVVHRDIKSSNILLDKKWNPKVSDFGLAKLLGSDASYVTTRVMGTFGYVAPEYASSGRLNEGSDVYSFGVLLMEIITGRSPVDYARPPGEVLKSPSPPLINWINVFAVLTCLKNIWQVNLVDWFKMMVANRRGEEMLDPRIEIHPSPRALKRVFLICLRCIDWNANKRPKMGQVVHMLEADDFPYRVVRLTPYLFYIRHPVCSSYLLGTNLLSSHMALELFYNVFFT